METAQMNSEKFFVNQIFITDYKLFFLRRGFPFVCDAPKFFKQKN